MAAYGKEKHEAALNYFKKHQNKLCEMYNGKWLLLRGARVIKAVDTFDEVIDEGHRLFGFGNYSVQECIPGPDAYTVSLSPSALSWMLSCT